MQYCFIPTKRGQYDVAEEIPRHIILSDTHQPQDQQSAIRITLISTTNPSLSPLSSLTHTTHSTQRPRRAT
ncbi:hypothetical protein BJ165DRAFT_1512323 [Panaeolus papilionaceus]|nr:hypothetical protein BJ165DRAFT_1512323 [Panaeolus papilionaceus]